MQIREDILFNYLILGFLISIVIGNGIYFLGPWVNQDIEVVHVEMGPQDPPTHLFNGSFGSRRVINRQSKSVDSQLIITDIKIIKKEVCRLEEVPTRYKPDYFNNISVCEVPENQEEVPNVTIRINRSLSYKIPPFKSVRYHVSHVVYGNPAKEIEDVFQFRNLVRLNYSLIVDGKEFNKTAQIDTQSSNLDIGIDIGVSSIGGTLEDRINKIKIEYKYLMGDIPKEINISNFLVLLFMLPWAENLLYTYLLGSPLLFQLLPFRPFTILMALLLGRIFKNKNRGTIVSIKIFYVWWLLLFIFFALYLLAGSQGPFG